MMEDRVFESQGQVAVHMAAKCISVPPGGSGSIALHLLNQGAEADFFKLSLQGSASSWVSMPSPVVRMRPGEEREVALVVQPPDPAQVGAGRYPLTVRVASHTQAGDVVEVEVTVIVSVVEVEGRVGLLLASSTYSVVPGENATVPIVLLNQSREDDSFQLVVDGLPNDWTSGALTPVPLAPGEQTEVSLTLRPPASAQSRAGRHPFRIQAMSQVSPAEVAEAACVLAVGTYTEFVWGLHPLREEAGKPVQITIDNQGNYHQVFRLAWRSLNDELDFEPDRTQDLRVPADERGVAEFRARPQRRPVFGGGMLHPYTVRVQSPQTKTKTLRGEVSSKALLPTWLLAVLLIAVLALVAVAAFSLVRGELPSMSASEPVAPQATPEGDGGEPTEGPPPRTADQAPSELTPQPPGAPTDQPVGAAEGSSLPALPCIPAAFSLVLVPLLTPGARRR